MARNRESAELNKGNLGETGKGKMTVEEAGRKGGETVAREIAAGKEALGLSARGESAGKSGASTSSRSDVGSDR